MKTNNFVNLIQQQIFVIVLVGNMIITKHYKFVKVIRMFKI